MSDVDLGAVEQEAPPVDAPAASTNGQGEDGIYYLASGKARFVIGGAPYTLRGPKVGEFRALHAMWVEGIGLDAQQQVDHQLKWVALLFNGDGDKLAGLSDHRLGDDPDEWPTWVGLATYQTKLMVHFRDVPLAPGGQAGL